MSKRALIADPDVDEARKQAAILQDDGYSVKTFQLGELFEELDQWQPDVLLLRHERPGQNGLALLTRIKRMNRFQGIAVVLTTSDLRPESIEEHSVQPSHADAYVRLPVGRQELLAAAHSLPGVLESDDVANVDDDVPAPPDLSKPPPLPPQRPPSLRSSNARPAGNADILTPKDLAYVEEVFSSIQAVDLDVERPVEPPPPSGPDRKLGLLRAKLREYEYKMGRLKVLWSNREEELNVREGQIEQERIEIDGLRLRISELEKEIEETRAEMADRESQHGKALTEHYDDAALREAQALNSLAAQQYETQKLKNKLITLEDEKNKVQKQLTEQILDWEKAYKQFESHHWAVVHASAHEMRRLEDQIQDREHASEALRVELKHAQASLGLWRLRHDEAQLAHRRSNTARASETEALHAAWDRHFRHERRARISAQDELAWLRPRVDELEENLHRHDKLLRWHDGERIRQLGDLAVAHARTEKARADLEARLDLAERNARELTRTLDLERALGEAAYSKVSRDREREGVIARAQEGHLTAGLLDAQDTLSAREAELETVSNRLAEEEAHHTEQRDRADDLAATLTEERRDFSAERSQLAENLAATTGDRDRTRERLSETETALAQTRESLASLGNELEDAVRHHKLALEQRDGELKSRQARITEIERDLDGAREDKANLQSTITARDERISELQSRVRSNDEAIVRLESQRDRLETQLAEHVASFEAQGEREATLMDKLAERDDEIAEARSVTAELQAALRASQGREAGLTEEGERLSAELAEGRALLAQQSARAQEQEAEIERQRVRVAEITADLDTARAEISVGATMSDELQSQLQESQARLAEQREREVLLDEQLGTAQGELAEAREQRADLERSLGQERARAEAIAASLEEAVAGKLSAVEAVAASEAASTEAAQLALSEARAEIDAGREREARLQATLDELQQRSASVEGELQAQAGDTSAALAAAEQRAATLEASLAERSAGLEAERQARALVEEELQRSRAAGAEAGDARAAMLESKLKETQATLDETLSTLDAARALEAQLAQAKARNAELESALASQPASDPAELERALTALAAAQEQTRQLSALNQALTTERDTLAAGDESNGAPNPRLAQLEQTLSRLSAAYDAARKQVNALRLQLETARAQHEAEKLTWTQTPQ